MSVPIYKTLADKEMCVHRLNGRACVNTCLNLFLNIVIWVLFIAGPVLTRQLRLRHKSLGSEENVFKVEYIMSANSSIEMRAVSTTHCEGHQ